MWFRKSNLARIATETLNEFSNDDCASSAAAIAYYTMFSLAPLLVITIFVSAFALERAGVSEETVDVESRIVAQIGSVIGERPAAQIGQMIAQANKPTKTILSTSISVCVLIFGATAIFAQLQTAMNRAWGVQPDKNIHGLRIFLRKRLLSFGLVLTVAFLLLVSLLLSVILHSLGNWLNEYFRLHFDSWIPAIIQTSLNFVVIAVVFAMLLKYLPDAQIRWRDVAVGSLLTSGLFGVGRFVISTYLSQSSVASGFGAAGSLVVVLVWIYYTTIIFLLGAEFTQVWTRFHGRQIKPIRGAVAVTRETKEVAFHPPEGEMMSQ